MTDLKTDLAYYHEAHEQLKKMLQFFDFLELHEIPRCKFYSYDSGACEEYCSNQEIKRDKDFDAKQECWQCQHRLLRLESLTLEAYFPKEMGMTKDALESNLEDLQCVGVFYREVVDKGDGWFRCKFNQKEWDESRVSTGCTDDMSDAQLFEQELQGQFIYPKNILHKIKVVGARSE